MKTDFFYSMLMGWSFMLIFWILTIVFIFIRKPPKSKLTIRIVIKSIIIFLLGYVGIYIFTS